jgi:transposase-like protein
MFAAEIRRKRVGRIRSLPSWRWHLDEVFLKINSVTHYLWRVVDHEGEVLEALVTKRWDRKAALQFLRKTTKRHGHPHVFVMDKLSSYGAALKDLGLPDDRETGRWLNNRAENSLRGPSVHISRFDDGNLPCSAFAGCYRSRSSSRSIHQSTTCSTETAPAPAETTSGATAPPLSPSGINSMQHNVLRVWANRDWFASV